MSTALLLTGRIPIPQTTSYPAITEALWRCDMSQVDSAVPLGAGDPQAAPTSLTSDAAHDSWEGQTPMHDAVDQAQVTARKPPEGGIEQATSLSQEPSPGLPPSNNADSSLSVACGDLHNVVENEKQSGACVTTSANPATTPHGVVNKGKETDSPVAPPISIVRQEDPRDTILSQALPPNTTAETTQIEAIEPQSAKHNRRLSFPHFPSLHKSSDSPAAEVSGAPVEGKMIFGHHSAASATQRRRNYANTNAVTDYEADLTSKDRAKQKEAVKKFLTERVKQDWAWEWPRPESNSSGDSPTLLEPSTTNDSVNSESWKERDEWLSNASDSGNDPPIPAAASLSPSIPSPNSALSKSSPFRFESPDGVGQTIKKSLHERKRRRKKRLVDEIAWNNGLRCFVARRDAWTCARRVSRISSVGLSPVKATKPASMSSEDGGSSTLIEQEDDEWEDDIEIPVAPPLLPPENAMRASILPAAYNTIYDKVVVQALTPSCPMNLRDVTRSCVQGWKRDGEWPPKSSMPDPPKRKARKLSVASLFGLEKMQKEEKGKPSSEEKSPTSAGAIRRSLQKILSLGHGGVKDIPNA